jgi:RNA polymerase sigma factor (TIGR02999 family)
MSEVTRILSALNQGDSAATAQLLPLVYEELRRLAADKLDHERPDHTLQPTALVHEAYVRLVDGNSDRTWDHRGHFFAAAAEAMRRILIDRARTRQSARRGGQRRRVALDESVIVAMDSPDQLLDLDAALTRFQSVEPRAAELVKLRFFAGLTNREAAGVLSISPRTADDLWAYARAWLFRELGGSES